MLATLWFVSIYCPTRSPRTPVTYHKESDV
jgi:hypothetical protein